MILHNRGFSSVETWFSMNLKLEPVNKDSDTKYVQLECSNEDHSESLHEEDEQESTQQEISDAILHHSTRERKMSDYYGNRVTVVDTSGDLKS